MCLDFSKIIGKRLKHHHDSLQDAKHKNIKLKVQSPESNEQMSWKLSSNGIKSVDKTADDSVHTIPCMKCIYGYICMYIVYINISEDYVWSPVQMNPLY